MGSNPRPATRGTATWRFAYQVVGQGRVDLVYFPSFNSNVEVELGEGPRYRRLLERLCFVLSLDRLRPAEAGAADRLSPGDLPAIETHAEDVAAVLESAAARGGPHSSHGERGCVIACLFAATFPDQVSAARPL